MPHIIDMTGKKYGKLTVIEKDGGDTAGARWKCVCDCGNVITVRGTNLRRGLTTSCGCHQKNVVKMENTTHGQYTSRLHRIWSAMKQRCYNPRNKAYINYGGRGISVCDDWIHDFSAFSEWALSNGYNDTLTIDRINNDGNYEPDNCRWQTRAQQNKNKRPWNCNRKTEILE